MATVKLAEALLRRKELQQKVDQIKAISVPGLFEVKVKRINVTDSVDDVTASVPKVTLAEITKEYDYYAQQLRLVDAAIQHANWTAEVEVGDKVMQNFGD